MSTVTTCGVIRAPAAAKFKVVFRMMPKQGRTRTYIDFDFVQVKPGSLSYEYTRMINTPRCEREWNISKGRLEEGLENVYNGLIKYLTPKCSPEGDRLGHVLEGWEVTPEVQAKLDEERMKAFFTKKQNNQ